MKENATIYLKGTQCVDGESDITELVSEGTVELSEKGLRLCYFESVEQGDDSQTTLTVVGETVKITRSGKAEMNMTVQLGKHRSCRYPSPLGTLTIGTYGTALSHENGVLKLSYDLDMNASPMSQNKLEITYILDKDRG